MEARKPKKTDVQRLVLRSSEAELLRGAHTVSRPAETQEETPELHICGECRSDLVYPTNWAPATAQRWSVHLRCPDCEWQGEGVYSQDAVDKFDEVLDEGSQAILDDLTKLTHANMSDEIDRFVDAIERDLVLPEDF